MAAMAAGRRLPPPFAVSPAAYLLRILLLFVSTQSIASHYLDCDFHDPCPRWHWNKETFRVANESSGPDTGGRDGHYLWTSANFPAAWKEFPHRTELRSDLVNSTRKDCTLQFWLLTSSGATLTLSLSYLNHTVVTQVFKNLEGWQEVRNVLGLAHSFRIILDAELQYQTSYLGVDSIRLTGCTDDDGEGGCTSNTEDGFPASRGFLCPSSGECIKLHQVCDMHEDCAPGGEDEKQECEKVPVPGRCNFESGSCGWNNGSIDQSDPRFNLVEGEDHTYQNESGHYLQSRFPPKSNFGHSAELNSVQFTAPPFYHRNVHSAYFKSCQVRFWYMIEGKVTQGHFYLRCVQESPAEAECGARDLWTEQRKKPSHHTTPSWTKAVVTIPPLTHSYSLRFVVTRGTKHLSVLIDDITMSPECFGIGIPANETLDAPTVSPSYTQPTVSKRYSFSSCGVSGRLGPHESLCQAAYAGHPNSSQHVTISEQRPGVQLWTVPESGLYSIFAVGASGGTGVRNQGSSRGAMVRGVFNLTQGEVIAILVGQHGTNACSQHTKREFLNQCQKLEGQGRRFRKGISDIFRTKKMGGGGGGGGATFIYKPHGMVPLLVAAGGGGLSADKEESPGGPVDPDAAGPNTTLHPSNGALVLDEEAASRHADSGPGGGWNDTTYRSESGRSLLEGGTGGQTCNQDWASDGGFGGGGGSCIGGGGGGGYRGGDAGGKSNGQGGVSFISSSSSWRLSEPGWSSGPGWATFLPPQNGCGCKHRCLPLEPGTTAPGRGPLEGPAFICLCPDGVKIDTDGVTCQDGHVQPTSPPYNLPRHHMIVIVLCILVSIGVIFFILTLALNKYRHKQSNDVGHEPMRSNPEVQLSRLRQAAAGGGAAPGAVTEYNPNYEFGGSTCTLQDLREVPRENLTLVKALGQGAFGEVYQGYLANAPGETSEIAVAVKTLPEVSSGQAGQDFMLEALIMSKFTHPNIVRFLGVCFQKLPRFIVLELLPGGDLKSFLREARPKPTKPSPLTMADLLRLAIDVAKGCQYLEENHFIHRDIAARNCLLTSKGADRVVKIADFGMARDIYKADYYRKGGKAMLPVKWMPPEAFLDGVFTSKTDVWSFGVLLWEVLSMGYMPYPGRGNQEVMQLVTSGGRLEPPTNCPGPVYHIMMQCWHPVPDERPAFSTILERLGYCVQDPDVVSAPLPVFHRPPSMEKDATLMRPPDGSDGCLQVIQQHPDLQSPGSEDYLIPMPSSNYSLSTERTELQSSAESVDRLLRLDEELLEGATGGRDPCWPDQQAQAETCFSASSAVKGSLEALPLAPASPRDPQPLDAAALNRMTNRPLPYVNVDVTGMASFEESAANC